MTTAPAPSLYARLSPLRLVIVGASLTAVTVMVAVCDVLLALVLSRATTVIERLLVVGWSLVSLY